MVKEVYFEMVDDNDLRKPGLLMTANWDSNVGYAWWLMETYWVVLAEAYKDSMTPVVAYPSISIVPSAIEESSLVPTVQDFSRLSISRVASQLRFIVRHRVRALYMSDKPVKSWVYVLFRMAGVKTIVVHDHTPGLRTRPTGLKRAVKQLMSRIPLYGADVCIGATEFVRQRLIDVACMPASKCFSVPNGIPLDIPSPQSIHEAYDIPEDRQVIVTAARANHYKGGFFALEVLAKVKAEHGMNNWHYVFMGDGPHREDFIRKARALGIEDCVSFPGRVTQVTAKFQTASFALHPSYGEVGYSLSILEYMLAGLPVVVSDNPSVCGATDSGRTGLIYQEHDTKDAAAAIARLLENVEHTEKMGSLAKQVVREQYSLSGAHQALREVFSTLGLEA